jgi:hypothetical protein
MVRNGKRDDHVLPLRKCGVPKPALERLAALGINTREELRDYWVYGNRKLLVDYLGESPLQYAAPRPSALLSRGVKEHKNLINMLDTESLPPLVKKPRGLALTAAQRKRPAEAPEPVNLTKSKRPHKPTVFLGARFPEPRDQGERGTCAAFATVAFLEFHLYSTLTETKHHSEQFLFWACKKRDRWPGVDGTSLSAARRALESRGVCLETTWPYDSSAGGPVDRDPPPDGAKEDARQYRWADMRPLPAKSIESLRSSLDDEKPVVLGVKTFPNWDFPDVEDTGKVNMPLPGEPSDGGHAVCLVGYEEDERVPGGGAFIFRNSWGQKWACKNRRFGPGYGTLFFEYVSRYGIAAYC